MQMSEKFTASNGLVFVPKNDGSVRWEAGNSPVAVTRGLREYFRHERDLELGRWRDPENMHCMAYATSDQTVIIFDESTGQQSEYSRQTAADSSHSYDDRRLRGIARAYFDAHPEPKPWMEVPDGVYAVTPQVHPYERLLQFRNGAWLHLYRSTSEEQSEAHTADWIAEVAYNEGRLTRLVPEGDDA